ncbi:MAG: hypothetical protein U0R24_03965 [Solirubrobacterales bacterium]
MAGEHDQPATPTLAIRFDGEPNWWGLEDALDAADVREVRRMMEAEAADLPREFRDLADPADIDGGVSTEDARGHVAQCARELEPLITQRWVDGRYERDGDMVVFGLEPEEMALAEPLLLAGAFESIGFEVRDWVV